MQKYKIELINRAIDNFNERKSRPRMFFGTREAAIAYVSGILEILTRCNLRDFYIKHSAIKGSSILQLSQEIETKDAWVNKMFDDAISILEKLK